MCTYIHIYLHARLFVHVKYIFVNFSTPWGSLQPRKNHTNEIDSDVDVGELQKVKFIWYNNLINLFGPRVGASRISVERNDGRV